MLNHARVLGYIKDHLGWPHVQVELTDEEIVTRFVTYSLREFSEYIPDIKKLPLNLADTNYQVPGIQNEWYLKDPDNVEILNVIEVYFGGSDDLLTGAPIFGPMSHFEIRDWALATEMAGQLKSFSSWDKTFEFSSPNVIRISPVPTTGNGYCTVEYERMQPPDLSKVPNEQQIIFCKLACADTMIQLGRIRKKYENMTTPFGTIPISAEIGDEGKELKREVIEKMERLYLPNVSVDFG